MDIPTPGKLKIIRIADPLFCIRCRHAYIADVLMGSGERQKMLYCDRRDCDQWVKDGPDGERPAKEVSPIAEPASGTGADREGALLFRRDTNARAAGEHTSVRRTVANKALNIAWRVTLLTIVATVTYLLINGVHQASELAK